MYVVPVSTQSLHGQSTNFLKYVIPKTVASLICERTKELVSTHSIFEIYNILCHSVMSVSFNQTYQLVREGKCVELILVKTDGGVGPVTVSIFTISDSAKSKFV